MAHPEATEFVIITYFIHATRLELTETKGTFS